MYKRSLLVLFIISIICTGCAKAEQEDYELLLVPTRIESTQLEVETLPEQNTTQYNDITTNNEPEVQVEVNYVEYDFNVAEDIIRYASDNIPDSYKVYITSLYEYGHTIEIKDEEWITPTYCRVDTKLDLDDNIRTGYYNISTGIACMDSYGDTHAVENICLITINKILNNVENLKVDTPTETDYRVSCTLKDFTISYLNFQNIEAQLSIDKNTGYLTKVSLMGMNTFESEDVYITCDIVLSMFNDTTLNIPKSVSNIIDNINNIDSTGIRALKKIQMDDVTNYTAVYTVEGKRDTEITTMRVDGSTVECEYKTDDSSDYCIVDATKSQAVYPTKLEDGTMYYTTRKSLVDTDLYRAVVDSLDFKYTVDYSNNILKICCDTDYGNYTTEFTGFEDFTDAYVYIDTQTDKLQKVEFIDRFTDEKDKTYVLEFSDYGVTKVPVLKM